jgi:hypothetical protein
MARTRPPKSFAESTLDLATIAVGQRFGRIYHQRYPEPLGYGKTPVASAILAHAPRINGSE